MTERKDRPVSRDETLFTIKMALFKARGPWPRRREPGDHDRLKPMARAICDHIELCGMRLFGKVPGMEATAPDARRGLRIAAPLKRLCMIALELSDPTALNASKTIVLKVATADGDSAGSVW